MAIGSSLTILTLFAIGTLADNGEFIRVDNPQGLGIEVQNVNAADTHSQEPLPSLWELKKIQELKLERLPLGPVISLSPQFIGSQPEARPQYVLAPTTKELTGSLSTRPSAQLLNVDQSQPKSPIWIIRVPPSQSPLYLVVVPQNLNRTPNSFAQLPEDLQKPKSENLGEDRFLQSLYNLSKIESEIQTIASQISDLQSASQNISNLAIDSSAQFRIDYSLLHSLLQSLTKNSLAQEDISKSEFKLPDQTTNSLAQPPNDLSHSESQPPFPNQTVLNLDQSDVSLSLSQLQNQTVLNLVQSNDSQPQPQLQNQTVSGLDQLGPVSESQNQTNHNLVQSDVILSQIQLQNQTVNNLEQSLGSQSLSQLQNQTLNSLDPSDIVPSHSGSQSQYQNQTVVQFNVSLSESQLQNQTVYNLVQSNDSLSLSQLQNQTVQTLVQSNDFLSQPQLQNQTVNSLDPSYNVLPLSGSQPQSPNQTVPNLDQSDVSLSLSHLQNQTVLNLVQSIDSQPQPQLQNQTVNGLDQLGPLSQSQNQTQSQFPLQNQTVNNPAQSDNVVSLTGSQPDSQNPITGNSVHTTDSLTQTQYQNKTSIITTINATLHITKSIKYVVEQPPPFFTSSDITDDSELQTFDLIEKYGYPSETRYIYTEDGYKLCMHRIPRPGAPAVLLVHGLMSSSVSWVQFGPTNGLAYILYRKGYDVWMLNTRGNIYSREHKEDLKPRDYWDFSFHEIGKFDLPPAIDLILKITQQLKVQYIGHSQGSTVFFVMCSERPEYASKVNLMQAMAPTVYLQDAVSPVLKFLAMFKGKFSMLVNLLGGYEISSKTRLIKQFRDHICSTSELASRICGTFDFVLCGFDWKSFNETLTPIVAAHASQGASAKLIYHYAQMQGKLNFQLFDHGRILNRIRYNDNEPPFYNLSLATTKVVIHHSAGDWLGVDSDVGHLEKRLPNVVESRKVQVEGFAHFDFTISKDVRPLVYDSVLAHLASHL